MIIYVLIEIIRINLLKKDNNDLLAGLTSLILFLFGIYVWIRYGLILDYGTEKEILNSKAELMILFAYLSTSVSILFILISIIKFVAWKLKQIFQK